MVSFCSWRHLVPVSCHNFSCAGTLRISAVEPCMVLCWTAHSRHVNSRSRLTHVCVQIRLACRRVNGSRRVNPGLRWFSLALSETTVERREKCFGPFAVNIHHKHMYLPHLPLGPTFTLTRWITRLYDLFFFAPLVNLLSRVFSQEHEESGRSVDGRVQKLLLRRRPLCEKRPLWKVSVIACGSQTSRWSIGFGWTHFISWHGVTHKEGLLLNWWDQRHYCGFK